jgi:hypothetical protein
VRGCQTSGICEEHGRPTLTQPYTPDSNVKSIVQGSAAST